jgi:hypothetical protein
MRGPVLVFAIAAAVAVSACGQKKQTIVSNGSTTVTSETHTDGTQSYTVTDAKGGAKMTVGTGAGANAKLPAYAPLYPGATVETSIDVGGANAGGSVTFKTGAAADAVIDFYKKSTASAGMTAAMNMTSGDTMLFSAKDDKTKHVVNVVTSKADGATNVQVT